MPDVEPDRLQVGVRDHDRGAGVVDEHVDPTERVDGCLCDRRGAGFFGDAGLHVDAVGKRCRETLPRFHRRRRVHNDLRAACRSHPCRRLADPA